MDENPGDTVLKEIEQIVRFSPFEEFRYKKELEDRKDDMAKLIENFADDVVVNSSNESEKIFAIMENLKGMLISGVNRYGCFVDEVKSYRKNSMIQQIRHKRDEISRIVHSTINSFIYVAEIHLLNDALKLAGENYSKAVNIVLRVDELNKFIKKAMIPDGYVSIQTSLGKRRHEEGGKNEVKPLKVCKLEDKEKSVTPINSVVSSIPPKQKNVLLPISLDVKMMIRFILNMRDLHENLQKNEKWVEEMHKEQTSCLLSSINEFTKSKREIFGIIGEEQEKLFREWENNKNQHVGVCNALLDMADFSNELSLKILESEILNFVLIEISRCKVFMREDPDGVIIRNGVEVCNSQSTDHAKRFYLLQTKRELVQSFCDYINRVETLRSELFDSYVVLISYFQSTYSDATTELHTTSDTLNCPHNTRSNIMKIDEDKRKDAKNNIKCLICSTKFSLAHLKSELCSGGWVRSVRGRQAIDNMLAMKLEEEHEICPDLAWLSQFCDYIKYIERLYRSAGSIQVGCVRIEEYCEKLQELYRTKDRFTIDDLRRLDENKKEDSDESLKQFYLTKYEEQSTMNHKYLKLVCGDFRYITTQFKKEISNEELDEDERSCPICMERFAKSSGYVGFPCGHRICQNCYPHFRNQFFSTKQKYIMSCVTCRRAFEHRSVIVAHESMMTPPQTSDDLIPGMKLTMKMRETIKLIRKIIQSDGGNMIVLLINVKVTKSLYTYLVEVLGKAGIPFNDGFGAQQKPALKFTKEYRLLLHSLFMELGGFDLTEASHVILLDPTDSYSVMEKALSQITQKSQRKEVTVYHMGVEETVDDGYRMVCKAGKGSKWKAGDIRKIFKIKPLVIQSNNV